ncbi:hypothetical protein AB0J68_01430 [Micromonospora sp. NPDC049580]|uniref:hypothetical protein n=1 Tax=Micromonospora sp. NPDC049580 TaxID=3154832 RepID=UPI0034238DDD
MTDQPSATTAGLLRVVTAERDEAHDVLGAAWATLNAAGRTGQHTIAEHIARMADELHSTQQVATFRQGVINQCHDALRAAGKVVNAARVIIDNDRLSRQALNGLADALTAYDAAPEVTSDEHARTPSAGVDPALRDRIELAIRDGFAAAPVISTATDTWLDQIAAVAAVAVVEELAHPAGIGRCGELSAVRISYDLDTPQRREVCVVRAGHNGRHRAANGTHWLGSPR